MKSFRLMRSVWLSVWVLLAVPVFAGPIVVMTNGVPSDLLQPPNGEAPIFLGVSGRLRDRASEVEVAMQRAAAEAARHVRVEVAYRSVTANTGRTVDLHEVYEVEWDRTGEPGFFERLEPVLVIRHDRGTLVWARVPEIDFRAAPPSGAVRTGTGLPPWVSSPPPAPEGYEVAVGVASRLREFTALIDAADASALAGIIESRRLEVEVVESARGDRRVEQHSVVSRTSSRGTVEGFTVLMRYWEERTGVLYSLAIGEVTGVR